MTPNTRLGIEFPPQRTSARVPRKVVLLHGISTDAPWYPLTSRIVSDLFETVEIKYPHFRWWAPLKLVGSPLMLGLTVVLAVAAWLFLTGPERLVAVASIVVLGVALARWRAGALLTSALDFVVEGLSEKLGADSRPPHLIAHSLGSWLSMNAAARFAGVPFARVVLCGCVLPRSFDWDTLLGTGASAAPRLDMVRNEMGLKDPVPRLAGMFSRLAPHFGSAGLDGFVDRDGVVHSLRRPDEACPQCTGAPVAPVHNVPLPRAGHSTMFVGGIQCKTAWVPFLFGYDPGEYRYFVDRCRRIGESADAAFARVEEAALFTQEWIWAKGSLVGRGMHLLHEIAPSAYADPDAADIVLVALGVFRRTVTAALLAADTNPRPVYRALDLHAALRNSLHAVLERVA